MAIGKLQVSVYGGTAARPLPGAKVTLLEQRGDGTAGVVIDELTSDVSGRCEEIELLCPPIEYSQKPNMPKPYSEFIIRASAYGFEPLEVTGIQIFDEMLGLQNLRMKQRGGQLGEEGIIRVGEHTLWEEYPPKIPESEVKDLPPDRGFIVLDKPVVPETIIVHDGLPNDSNANNYHIPFKDYIKNVASSEIYSTWPDETIRANVLAILSFTLNRVFTEWYRAKGKNFTITSSTTVDHAFFYGRTVYDSIARIVDELFTTYVTKPGIRQPLLTQYCDGQKVSCPNWMTQWGSKAMGDEGHSAVNILRSYYGSDIYLAEAEQVEGIPSSYPGVNLTIGSSGPPVRTIQYQLNQISNHYPAIPKLAEDGVYGPSTAESVKTFQQVFNMPATGIVDFPTWYRISEIYVAVNRLAELR